MKTIVELSVTQVKFALQKALDSELRAQKAAKPAFQEIYTKEVRELQNALNTLTETK